MKHRATISAASIISVGLALAMPFAVGFAAGRLKRVSGSLFGFPGFLATDNVQKAPQRTGLNVIALGGALGIMVATASLVQGLKASTTSAGSA